MITIEKYNHKMLNIWDDFISNANNGTIFHTQKFISYHITRDFNNHSLLFYYNKKLVCLLPAAKLKDALCSHPGASFGGLIFNNTLSFKIIGSILESLIYYCKQRFKSIVIINTPLIYYKTFDASINYLLLWNHFKCSEHYISHFVDLTRKKTVGELLSKRKKRYINNMISNKTFSLILSKKFNEFYSILLDSKQSFDSTPTHSLEEIKKLHLMFPNDIKLFLSMKNGQVAGGALIFYTSQNTCLVFYNVVKAQYKNSQLAALQLYNCMKQAKKQGSSIIDFGVSHIPESKMPLEPKTSLIQFKEQFGAKGVLRTVYKKDFNEK